MTQGNEAPPTSAATSGEDVSQFGYEQQLERALTLKDLIIYGLLFMVIVAPFSIFGQVHDASFGMTPFVYLVGLVAMLFTALSYAAMSRKFPMAGSVYTYVQRGLNPHIGFVAGWLILIDYLLIPALLYSFCGVWMHGLIPATPGWMWVIILVVINTTISFLGIKFTAAVDWVFFAVEIFAFAAFMVVGILYLSKHGLGTGVSSWIEPIFDAKHINLGFIASAASIACLSFLGFDGISTLAEETKKPEKTVGKATFLSLLFIGLIFIASTWVGELAQGKSYVKVGSDAETNLFFTMAKHIGGPGLYWIVFPVVIIASGIPNALAAQSAVTRILFSMARDGLMPKPMGKLHSRFKSPYISLFVVAILTLACSFLGPNQLVRLVNFGGLSSFIVLNFAVFWYFFIREGQRHSFKQWVRYLLCPFIGMAILIFVWTGFPGLTKIVGLSWLVIGIIIGAIQSKGYKKVPPAFDGLNG
ncbi:MAG: APC family permease [Bifidobacteriaceae bacterium]|jgi:amino acid transporter|nr:APC family permease [Bifidobacteriaceae bacterium]